MRLAFIGFRHGHAIGFFHAASGDPRFQIVGACEEDAATAESIRAEGRIGLTHASYAGMLDEVECEAVGVGDVYAKRGSRIVEALRRGKHVIADKPVCTRLDELEEIAQLVRERGLRLGCLLDLRANGAFLTARRLLREGAIGAVRTITFSAQHPLLFGTRPGWYFEPGMHGGTINDIGVHAFDAIPWLTGRRFVEVVGARAWNARLPQVPHFQDAAQFMLRLDNGAGILGDVSYLAPDGCGYGLPQYWRMTFHGDAGVMEWKWDAPAVMLAGGADKEARWIESEASAPLGAAGAFLAEVAGSADASPSTAEVLAASRVALLVQRAADEDICNLPLVED